MNHKVFNLFIKYFLCCVCFVSVFSSCETKKQKLQTEYKELKGLYHQRFTDDSYTAIYNPKKDYIINACYGIGGWGLNIVDLSEASLQNKVDQLRHYYEWVPAIQKGTRYDWLNDYIHEAIDNYTKYGEDFLLIWPSGQRDTNPPKK